MSKNTGTQSRLGAETLEAQGRESTDAPTRIQLNLTLEDELVKEIKIEAVQMGMKVSTYVERILRRRGDLLKT